MFIPIKGVVMKDSEIVKYYTDKESLDRLINVLKEYTFEQLIKSKHYEDSLLEKNTDEKLLKEYYPQFNRVKLVGLRKREGKKSNYDVFYELDDGTAILFAIDIDKTPPTLMNAFHFNRSLKKFIEYIIKKYGREMI